MQRNFGLTKVSRAIQQNSWANNFQITSERRFGFDFNITLGSFSLISRNRNSGRILVVVAWRSIFCPSLQPFLHLVVNFLSLQICKYCISFLESRRGKSLPNPMHKLFSVSWAETSIMLLVLLWLTTYSPWFVVAKGAEKCLQFFISCHSICSSRDGVETFLQMESVNEIHFRILVIKNTCYLSRMEIFTPVS